MAHQHAIFAVHRNEKFRMDEGNHRLELFLRAVAGDVDLHGAIGNDVRAETHQFINRAADARLVSGNRRGRNNHRIARVNGNLAMAPARHARETGHRFALAARRQNAELVFAVAIHLVRLDQRPFRHLEIAELAGNRDDIHHGAAENAHFPVMRDGGIDGHLHAGHIRRECRQNDAPLHAGKRTHQSVGHDRFRRRVAGTLRIRGVRAERQHPAMPDFREFMHIHELPVDRRVIEFEIARVDDRAKRRAEINPARIRNRMADMEETDFENTEDVFFPRFNHIERRLLDARFFEFPFDEPASQPRRVHRRRHLAQKIRKRTDMILVPVRNHNGANFFFIFDEIAEIRDDDVDPRHVVLRKRHPRIQDDDILAVANRRHIFSDFSESSQRNNL